MTVEHDFFKCFDIEPYDKYYSCEEKDLEGECLNPCVICDDCKEIYCYPNVTDKILLSLIVLFVHETGIPMNIPFTLNTTKELKEEILKCFIWFMKSPIIKNSKKTNVMLKIWKLFGINNEYIKNSIDTGDMQNG